MRHSLPTPELDADIQIWQPLPYTQGAAKWTPLVGMRNNHQSEFVCPSSRDTQSGSQDVSLLDDSLPLLFVPFCTSETIWLGDTTQRCDVVLIMHFTYITVDLWSTLKLHPSDKMMLNYNQNEKHWSWHIPHICHITYTFLLHYIILNAFSFQNADGGAQDQLFIDLLIVFLVFFIVFFWGHCITASDINLL